MKVSLRWLSEYVELRLSPEELAHRLTMAGLAVDSIERPGVWGDDIRVGRVAAVEPHPNADRLRLATVDLGDGDTRIVVCGAPNVATGQMIAFAGTGARIRDGHTGKESVLKPATIRGVESGGMVLSERELGLSEEHEGILVLADDAPIGQPLSGVLGDTIFDLSITPNRPDWLSVLGVAREVAALSGATVNEPSTEYEASGPGIEGRASVEIADPDLCQRYVATVIEGVKIEESPRWLRDRLEAIGQRPINNVVDVTNYVMFELGQPLHAFDYDRIAGHRIIVRRAGDGEAFTTLDGVARKLTNDMLAITDASGPVALAGVIGGMESEVTDSTVNVLLEAANFAATNIRRTSTALKARSEASLRFEKGLPPELAAVASRRATKLFVEVCGGVAARGAIDVYPRKQQEVRIELRRERLVRLLGIDPPSAQVCDALIGLGFGATWTPPERYTVTAPYWRTDVSIADDVAEEVARIIGYDTIPAEALAGAVPPEVEQPLRSLRERARDALATAGMQEVITYSLTTMEALQQVVPPEDLATYPPLRVVNPLSAEYEYLRPVLRANLLRTLGANIRQHEGEVALFEAARAYLTDPEGGRPQEQEHIVGVVGGQREDRWGHASAGPVDFYDAKGYVEAALGAVAIDAVFNEAALFGMLPGRAAEIIIDGRRVGSIGQVHPKVASAFDIDREVYLFELIVDELLPSVTGVRRAEPIVRFPGVAEDLAIVVEKRVTAAAVRSIIEQHALVRSAEVFDVYEGEQIGASKKSLAFSVIYQSPDHTLDDKEVAKARQAIVARLKNELNAELRG